MCGIVGYVGGGGNSDTLLTGLRRLEYRGYDSSGIALIRRGNIETTKCVGHVEALANKVGKTRKSPIGIGHTRWATHGGVTEANAHPHMDERQKVAVVHNGIIENFVELREELIDAGILFTSQTDTEVIAQLIGYSILHNPDDEPVQHITRTIARLRGTYGLAAIFKGAPDVVIVARKGSPLVLGSSNGTSFIASDPNALIGWAQQFVTLDDDEVAEVFADGWKIRHINTGNVNRTSQELTNTEDPIDLAGYPHFMLKEIHEQPEALRRCLAGRLSLEQGRARMTGLGLKPLDIAKIQRVGIIGCGTSYHAGLVAATAFERWAGIRTHAYVASELRYSNPIVDASDVFFAVSQSGETADTLGAVQEVQSRGATVMGIVNVVGSTLARQCGRGVYIHSGPEISVASTKAFTSQVTALFGTALLFARSRNMSQPDGANLIQNLLEIPDMMEEYLTHSGNVEAAAEIIAGSRCVSFIGRGNSYPVAMEGALKLKELAYVPSMAYPAGELKHGPIALLDKMSPVVAVVPADGTFDKMISNLEEASARGAPVIVVCQARHLNHMNSRGFRSLVVPDVAPILSPLMTVLPLQLLAYRTAVMLGHNVDRPRNLAKSVTVE
jgi:glucosamine--fructose-6-phosphate aminotransferase (isomerizing)